MFSDYKKPDKSGRKFEIALRATVLDGSSSSFHQMSLDIPTEILPDWTTFHIYPLKDVLSTIFLKA